MLSTNGIRTLINVIIADPISADLVSCVASFHGVTTTVVAQRKGGLYHDQHPMDASPCHRSF
jgi:hypothetical protein